MKGMTNFMGVKLGLYILREEHRLRVFENRVLRRIFGPTRDKVLGGSRGLHNEELHNLYSSPSIIRMIKSRRLTWAEDVACIGKKMNPYRILVGKPKGKRLLGRCRLGWYDYIHMVVRKIGWGGMDWIDLVQDRDL
jgi:hypothetical protein